MVPNDDGPNALLAAPPDKDAGAVEPNALCGGLRVLVVPVSMPNATPNPLLAAPPAQDIGAAEPNALCGCVLVVPAVEAPKPVDCPNAGFGSDPEFCCGVDVELPNEGAGCPDELLGPTLALEFPPAAD